MKTKVLILLSGLLVLSLLLEGCSTGLTPSSWPGITSDAKYAYIAAGQAVYAVDLQTGTEIWRYPQKASASSLFYAAPVLTPDGQLVIGGYGSGTKHILSSLNPGTGAANSWVFDQAHDRYIGAVLVLNDMIYAPNADYNLYALSLQGAPQSRWPFKADQGIWAAPVTDGQRIYFGTLGRNVYAVDVKTGQQVWDTPLDGAILGSPVLGNGLLFTGTYGGTVYALDKTSGKIKWKTPASSWIWSGPVLDGGTLYFGDGSGTFYSLSAVDGTQNWQKKLSSAVVGSPLVNGGNIIVGTEAGNLYVFDNAGNQIRTTALDGKLYASPVAAGDLILVASTGGQSLLVALAQDGTQKWAFTPAK